MAQKRPAQRCALASPCTRLTYICADLLCIVFVWTDPSLLKTTTTKKTRRVLSPAVGNPTAAQPAPTLTAHVAGRNLPMVHVTCVLAASTGDSIVTVEPVAYLECNSK